MGVPSSSALRDLAWLGESGVTAHEIGSLNPCLPGEFTLPDTLYVNTATPGTVYTAGGEGTLPLLAGRWFLIPGHIAQAHPDLARNTDPVAYAVFNAP